MCSATSFKRSPKSVGSGLSARNYNRDRSFWLTDTRINAETADTKELYPGDRYWFAYRSEGLHDLASGCREYWHCFPAG